MTDKNKGVIYVISAAFFFSLMTLFVRLSGDLPAFEKSFFRNLVALFFAYGVLKRNHIPLSWGDNSNLKYLLGRSIAGAAGVFCNFYAIDHLVIADANMLNKLSPFFAVLFSYILIKEKVRPYQIACVTAAFIGALFILKPGGNDLNLFAAFIGLMGGLGAGLAYTNVRLATKHGVPGPFVVFFFSMFTCIVSIPLSIPVFVMPKLWQIGFLLLAGVAATGGQFSITAAYAHAPAASISVYDYTQIIFATILGMIFLGEMPDYLSFIGYAIICIASVSMFLLNRKHAERS